VFTCDATSAGATRALRGRYAGATRALRGRYAGATRALREAAGLRRSRVLTHGGTGLALGVVAGGVVHLGPDRVRAGSLGAGKRVRGCVRGRGSWEPGDRREDEHARPGVVSRLYFARSYFQRSYLRRSYLQRPYLQRSRFYAFYYSTRLRAVAEDAAVMLWPGYADQLRGARWLSDGRCCGIGFAVLSI